MGGVVALVGLAALTVLAWTRDRPLAALVRWVWRSRRPASWPPTACPTRWRPAGSTSTAGAWVLAFVVWWAAGWVIARALVRGFRRSSRRLVGSPALALGTIVAIRRLPGHHRARRRTARRRRFAIDRRLGDIVERRFGDDGPVMVVDDGTAANLSVAPALIARLVDEGTAVRSRPSGSSPTAPRALRPRDRRVRAPGGEPVRPAGRTAGPACGGGPADLADRAGRRPPRGRGPLGPGAPVGRGRRPAGAAVPAAGRAGRQAHRRHGDEPLGGVDLDGGAPPLLDGYLDSPTFDRADLRAMLDAAPEQRTLWTDDRAGVYELTLDELRALRPDLFAGS